MTPQPSDTTGGRATVAGPGQRPRLVRRLRWPMVLCGVLVVVAVAVALFVAYDNGIFTRGPAVDAATTYVADVQDQRYSAAYALLSPDLRRGESEQAFANRMHAIDATDGRITAVSVAGQQESGRMTVVQLTITRARRGTFTAYLAVRQSGGAWLVTGADDL